MRYPVRNSNLVALLSICVPLLACKALSKKEDSKAEGTTTESAQKSGSPSVGSSPEPSTVSVAVKEKAQLGGLDLWVDEVRDCKYERGTSQESLQRQGKRLVGALVYVEGTNADGNTSFSSSAWKAYDGEGITYSRMTPRGTDCEPLAQSARVAKGDKKKGWIGFQIPSATKTLTIKHEHSPPRTGGAAEKQVVSIKLF